MGDLNYYFFSGRAYTTYPLGTSSSFFVLSNKAPVEHTTKYCLPLASYIAGMPLGLARPVFIVDNIFPLSASYTYTRPSPHVENTSPVAVITIPFVAEPFDMPKFLPPGILSSLPSG